MKEQQQIGQEQWASRNTLLDDRLPVIKPVAPCTKSPELCRMLAASLAAWVLYRHFHPCTLALPARPLGGIS